MEKTKNLHYLIGREMVYIGDFDKAIELYNKQLKKLKGDILPIRFVTLEKKKVINVNITMECEMVIDIKVLFEANILAMEYLNLHLNKTIDLLVKTAKNIDVINSNIHSISEDFNELLDGN